MKSPTGKPLKLRPVRANVGFAQRYRRALERMVDEMHHEVIAEIGQLYEDEEPKIATDVTPAAVLAAAIRRIVRRWQVRFDMGAAELAAYFAKEAGDRTDAQLRMILKRAGFTVPFVLTPGMRDVLEAAVHENVALIKSIGSQYLTGVEGDVMRAVSVGRDLQTLNRDLRLHYGVTRRRAALIARDQTNKATAAITRQRQVELGITEAIWRHSHAGKHPRPEHVAFDGHRYDTRRGAFLEGKWTWPGVEINCRCFSQSVIPGVKLT